jgi:hypothetical protein
MKLWKRKIKCPINQEDKDWVIDQLNWIDQNIVKLDQQKTILPTKSFFDRKFDGSEDDAHFVLTQLGQYFRVDTKNIDLNFYSEKSIELDRGLITQKEEGSGTAGLYSQREKGISISIEIQQLSNLTSLIATIGHELCHYVLIGVYDIYIEGDENEWLTDLLAIAFGLGIFLGNSKFNFNQFQSGDGWGGWSYSIQGYLPQQIIAFAMAEIDHRKGLTLVEHIDYMKKDFRNDYNKSSKYLRQNK